MKRYGPFILVVVAIVGYEVGEGVRWAKSEWDRTREQIEESKQSIESLTDETVETVKKFRDVLDSISNVFKEMKNEVASSRSGIDSGVNGSSDTESSTDGSIEPGQHAGPSTGISSGGYQQPDLGARTTSEVSPSMDFPRFD